MEGLTIQFFWQFPHFIAIAWVLDEEYKNSFKMLFGGKKGRYPALSITSLITTLISIVPFFWNHNTLSYQYMHLYLLRYWEYGLLSNLLNCI